MTWGERLTTATDDAVSLQLTYTKESTREGPDTSETMGRGDVEHLNKCPCRGTCSPLLMRLTLDLIPPVRVLEAICALTFVHLTISRSVLPD